MWGSGEASLPQGYTYFCVYKLNKKLQPTFLFISLMISSTCVSVGSLVQSWLKWRIQTVVISVPNFWWNGQKRFLDTDLSRRQIHWQTQRYEDISRQDNQANRQTGKNMKSDQKWFLNPVTRSTSEAKILPQLSHLMFIAFVYFHKAFCMRIFLVTRVTKYQSICWKGK